MIGIISSMERFLCVLFTGILAFSRWLTRVRFFKRQRLLLKPLTHDLFNIGCGVRLSEDVVHA